MTVDSGTPGNRGPFFYMLEMCADGMEPIEVFV